MNREPATTKAAAPVSDWFSQHERRFATNVYVYPVISRRSRGLSIGVNLNPDKVCNFDCIYCQVDRRVPGGASDVDVARVKTELYECLQLGLSGEMFELPSFASTPAHLRRVNDIAFSGDGEPTTCRNFDDVVAACVEVKEALQAHQVKLVLITNASMFHRPRVQKALQMLDAHQGEIWAKLDAGTEAYYRLVDRTAIPFQHILDNILDAARRRPLVIQSLWMRIHGVPPTEAEIAAYCERLRWLKNEGGRIAYVQVYTVARRPAEDYVSPLSDEEVDAIRDRVVQETGIPAVSFYAQGTSNLVIDV